MQTEPIHDRRIHRRAWGAERAVCGAEGTATRSIRIALHGVGVTCADCTREPSRDEMWAQIEAAAARFRAKE